MDEYDLDGPVIPGNPADNNSLKTWTFLTLCDPLKSGQDGVMATCISPTKLMPVTLLG